jgi:hypothetical protein
VPLYLQRVFKSGSRAGQIFFVCPIVFVLSTIKWDHSATNAKEKQQKGENKQ